jgi:hypothetical protein
LILEKGSYRLFWGVGGHLERYTFVDPPEKVRFGQGKLVDIARPFAEVRRDSKHTMTKRHIELWKDRQEEFVRFDSYEYVEIVPPGAQSLMLKSFLNADSSRLDLDLLSGNDNIVRTIRRVRVIVCVDMIDTVRTT